MTLSETQASRHPNDSVEAFAPLAPGFPPLPRSPSLACCAHYPGGSAWCLSVADWRAPAPGSSQPALAFPERTAGRHPHLFFRGLLKLSLTLRPAELLTHLRGLCHEAPTRPVNPAESLVSYQGIPTTPWVGPSPTGNLRHRGARSFHQVRPFGPD